MGPVHLAVHRHQQGEHSRRRDRPVEASWQGLDCPSDRMKEEHKARQEESNQEAGPAAHCAMDQDTADCGERVWDQVWDFGRSDPEGIACTVRL